MTGWTRSSSIIDYKGFYGIWNTGCASMKSYSKKNIRLLSIKIPVHRGRIYLVGDSFNIAGHEGGDGWGFNHPINAVEVFSARRLYYR